MLQTKSSVSLVLRGGSDELGDSDIAHLRGTGSENRFLDSVVEFAKHGACGLILHYQGNAETEVEIQSLQSQVESDTLKVVTVPGDIGDPDTSTKVGSILVPSFYLIDRPMREDR